MVTIQYTPEIQRKLDKLDAMVEEYTTDVYALADPVDMDKCVETLRILRDTAAKVRLISVPVSVTIDDVVNWL